MDEKHERPPGKPRQFSVVEKGYSGERVVFITTNETDALRVKNQHAARRIVIS